MPTLWNRVPSESNHLSPMLQGISLNMAVKKNSTKPVDPSNFLWALKRNLSSMRVTPFDYNSKQDVAKILQVVLDELKGVSLAASSLISNKLRTTTSALGFDCWSEWMSSVRTEIALVSNLNLFNHGTIWSCFKDIIQGQNYQLGSALPE